MVATRLKYNLIAGTHYLDLSRDLSEYHRKLHRQKQVFTVYGGFIRNNNSASAKFNVAPLTWQSKAAVNRAFKIWRKMISETLKDKPGLQSGKWNDFKVYLDNQHGYAGTSAVDAAGNRMSVGEWDYSTLTQPKLIDPDGDGGLEFDGNADQWELAITGAHTGHPTNYSRVSMIQSWLESRAIVPASTPENMLVTTDPLSNMFNVQDDDSEKVTILQNEGDAPPYSRTLPYGSDPTGLAPVSIADNGASATITPVGNQVHGFQALCGLVQVVVSGSGTTEVFIDVESQGESF
jgi:hypothetical protein